MPALQRDYALAGSVLLDLTLESRIDMGPERLFVLDPEPVGDDLLDPMLARIVQSSETHDAGHWIRQAVAQAGDTFERSAGRLVGRGILDRKDRRFLGIRRRSRYAITDARAARGCSSRNSFFALKEERINTDVARGHPETA